MVSCGGGGGGGEGAEALCFNTGESNCCQLKVIKYDFLQNIINDTLVGNI